MNDSNAARRRVNGGVFLAVTMLLFALSIAAIMIAARGGLWDKKQPPQETQPTASDVQPQSLSWTGTRKGVISGNASFCASPNGALICEYGDDTPLIALELRDGWVYCRIGTKLGWVEEQMVLWTGELTPLQGATDKQPEELGGEAKDALDGIFSDYGCVGGSAAVIRAGELAYTYSYGKCDPYAKTLCTTETKFRVASISKMLVAMSAVAMQEQGFLSLDDDIGDYFSEPVRNPYNKDIPISFRMLLTHSSTIDSFSMNGVGQELLLDYLGVKGVWIKSKTPGTLEAWQYSNSGMATCAAALELACGETLVEYTDEYFFSPLDADASFHASFISDSDSIAPCYLNNECKRTVSQLLARPYSETPGDNFASYAGGLLISSEDLAKLVCILANDGCYNGMYYLSPESVALLETEQFAFEDFTQCIGIRYCSELSDGRSLYYHNGQSFGVVSVASYDPATGDGVVVIANGSKRRDQYENGMSYLGQEVSDYCYSKLCA